MSKNCLYIVNIVLTCITCALLIVSCGGCNPEQIQQASVVANQVHPMIDTASPVITSQPWYIYVMLAADIASSALAAWLSIRKRQEVAEKSEKNGNN